MQHNAERGFYKKCVQDELLSHAASLHGVPSALLSSPGPLMHLPNHGVCKVLLLKAEASRYVYTNGRVAESQSRKTGHLQIRVPMPEMPDQCLCHTQSVTRCSKNVYTPGTCDTTPLRAALIAEVPSATRGRLYQKANSQSTGEAVKNGTSLRPKTM